MKKNKLKVIFISVGIVVFISIVGLLSFYLSKKLTDKNLDNINWLRKNVSVLKDSYLGEDIYSVNKNKNISIYNLKYQKVVNEKIEKLLDNSSQEYIVIYNPYGTNKLSVNVYFKDDDFDDLQYEVSSSKDGINDFSKELVDGKSAFQLIGLIPSSKNEVSITSDALEEEIKFSIDLSDVASIGEAKLKVEDGDSDVELADGLYAMLGNDSDEEDYLAFYDNDGIMRSEIPLIGYRAHSILFDDDKMYFSISQTRIVEMDNLGQVTNIYRTGDYQLHHDYVFDDDKNFLVLANNTLKDTEEDCIIKIDRETKEVTELVDFEDVFKSYVSTCELDTKSQRDEGEDGLDWLHLNSIEYVDGDVILSSRETSSIIKVSNILNDPKVEYIISNDKFWKGTDFEDLVFTQKGDFKIHSGQHSVRYTAGENENEYYLTFFNNNYGVSNSQPSFSYKDLGITNDNPFQGDVSYYYVYKVDEENRTFELVDDFEVEYSGIVSSVQELDNDNVLVDSGTKGIFAEYDDEHNLIRKFTAKMNKYMVYRVLKYDFSGFWFK